MALDRMETVLQIMKQSKKLLYLNIISTQQKVNTFASLIGYLQCQNTAIKSSWNNQNKRISSIYKYSFKW